MTSSEQNFDENMRVLASLHGFIEFDREAVARAIRSNTLSPLERGALANLVEGTHAGGLMFRLHGQAKRRHIKQMAARYERCQAIGARFHEVRPLHETWLGAVEQVADEFGISEPTVAADLAAFKFFQDTEK